MVDELHFALDNLFLSYIVKVTHFVFHKPVSFPLRKIYVILSLKIFFFRFLYFIFAKKWHIMTKIEKERITRVVTILKQFEEKLRLSCYEDLTGEMGIDVGDYISMCRELEYCITSLNFMTDVYCTKMDF